MKQTPSIFETIADYGTDASTRSSANSLEQIKTSQELEAAKNNNDKEAYVAALAKMKALKKQEKFQQTLNGSFYAISLVFILIQAAIVIGVGILIFSLIF